MGFSPTLNLQGTTLDDSGNQNILIGQNCTANLNLTNLPSGVTAGTPTWSVSGFTYTNFDISQDQETGMPVYFDSPLVKNSPVTWYWAQGGDFAPIGSPLFPDSETIQVSVPLTYTQPGSNSPQSLGNVIAKQTVLVWNPYAGDQDIELGTVGVSGYDVTSGMQVPNQDNEGFDLYGEVGTPDMFRPQGTGSWAWLQLCKIYVTQGAADDQMTEYQLDSAFPYNITGGMGDVPGILWDADSTQDRRTPHPFGDTPQEPFWPWYTSVAFSNAFKLYMMYQPPDAGTGTNWVPLLVEQWWFGANMSRPDVLSDWTPNPPGYDSYLGRMDNPDYPFWVAKHLSGK